MKKRANLSYAMMAIVAVALMAGLAGYPCSAEGPRQPPNPILPPTIIHSDVPSVTPPSPPTVSGVSVDAQAKAPAGKAASGKAAQGAQSDKTTASALSMLGLGSDNALLKALSGAAGGEEGTDALSSLLGGKGGTALRSSDDETLKKILELLEKQEARSSADGANTATSPPAESAPSVAPIVSGGELVRFSVNGYSVLPSITTIVSSVMARDGSFLITGDRSYSLAGQYVPETFYLLCRKTGPASYRLFADVTQGRPNERSIPWRLARISPITGTLTGDLLVFRAADPEWRLDLVIRVVSPSVPGNIGR